MRRVLKAVAAVMLIAAVAVTGFAATSVNKTIDMSTGSGDGSSSSSTRSSGSGAVSISTITNSGPAATVTAATTASPSNGGNTVSTTTSDWTQRADGTWSLNVGGHQYASEWLSATNPYAGGATEWFFFDANGTMVTGWVWVRGADGVAHCYYFNPFSDGSKGAAQLGGVTPDGYELNANGEWVVDGVAQTK